MENATADLLATILAGANDPTNLAAREFLRETLPGTLIECEYHSARYRTARPRFKRRRFRIDRVRDPNIEPLLSQTLTADPDLVREGVLLYGFDLDQLYDVKLWTGSLRNVVVSPEEQTFSVLWFEAENWFPGTSETLPEECRVLGTLIDNVSGTMARVIADGANDYLRKIDAHLQPRPRFAGAADWKLSRGA